jgi:hypothetical protein
MSVGAINMANRGLVLNNSIGSVNLFRWEHYETIQRGSLAAIRYTACAFMEAANIFQEPVNFNRKLLMEQL